MRIMGYVGERGLESTSGWNSMLDFSWFPLFLTIDFEKLLYAINV